MRIRACVKYFEEFNLYFDLMSQRYNVSKVYTIRLKKLKYAPRNCAFDVSLILEQQFLVLKSLVLLIIL